MLNKVIEFEVRSPNLDTLTWWFDLGWLPWCYSGPVHLELCVICLKAMIWASGRYSVLHRIRKMSFGLCLKDRTNLRFSKVLATEGLGYCCVADNTEVDFQPLQYQGHLHWLNDSEEVLSWHNNLPEEKIYI